MFAQQIVAKSKAAAKRNAAPRSVPDRVRWIWDEIKNKKAKQLFDPSPKKRLEAVTALLQTFTVYDRRQSLLVAAVLGEPDTLVRRALLDAIASLHGYVGWQDIVRMREGAQAFFEDEDPSVRFACARCFVAMPIALVEEDLVWLSALARLVTCAPEIDLVATLVVRAIAAGVAKAQAFVVLAQLARHQSFGHRALWASTSLLHEPEMKRLLIELVEKVCAASDRASLDLSAAFENTADASAIAALEAYRARLDGYQWHTDLAIGVVDPTRLGAMLQRYEAEVSAALRNNVTDRMVLDALSWAPEHAAKHVATCASTVVALSAERPERALRWIRGNRAQMAQVLAPQLASSNGTKILEHWESLSPETAAEDAVAVLAAALEEHPSGALPYEAHVRCEACCALLLRVGRLPAGAMPLLSKLCARLAPYVVSTALVTVRAMHTFGATDEDFAAMVDVFERDARESDGRVSSDPMFDPARSWGTKLRCMAVALRSLGSIARVRASWDAFAHVWSSDYYLDQKCVLMMLAPYIHEPDVRVLFEEALMRKSGEVQREAARALGLLYASA